MQQVHIISGSFTALDNSTNAYEEILKLQQAGIILVVSAGNSECK